MATKRKVWQRAMPEKNANEDEEELLVFGYSCKLFRDDEKALYVEKGKHLIPWMGDDRLMIDRYDGRGYLHDLDQYETKPRKDLYDGLTEEEMKVEAVCDEERYMALYKDISEEEMYHQEEMKRLRMALASDGAYNEVGFQYNEDGQARESYDPSEPTEEVSDPNEEHPFIAPPELAVPEGFETPPTVKMNAIIEKTAMFVAQHGLQMEIVIKTKQSKNSQFAFMQFDHSLNPYYKHMIEWIKAGKYRPGQAGQAKHQGDPQNGGDDEDEDEDDDDDGGSHYLHPSLLGGTTNIPTVLPKIQYQRGASDDYYAMLVKQLQEVKRSQAATESPNRSPTSGQHAGHSASQSGHYNSSGDSVLPPPPGVEPVTLPPAFLEQMDLGTLVPPPPVEKESAVAYPAADQPLIPPPPDIQPIVDKMACYVAKNGKDFETVVLAKGDKRFDFLNSWHEYHSYYKFKKSLFENQLAKEAEQLLAEANAAEDLANRAKGAPVSFSIKPKEPEVMPLEKCLALDESSSDSDSDPEKKEKKEQKKREAAEKLEREAAERKEAEPPIVEEKATAAAAAAPTPVVTEKVKKVRPEPSESKLAEEKIKDRLAAAARDRMSSASREKQLQLERKRRAAIFMAMKRKERNRPRNEPQPMIGPQMLSELATPSTASDEEVGMDMESPGNISDEPLSVLAAGSAKSSPPSSPEPVIKEIPKSPRELSPPPSRTRSRSPKVRHSSRSQSRRHRSRSKTRRKSPPIRHKSRSPSLPLSPTKLSTKAKTPPAAYAVVRRSHSPSPRRKINRSRSRSRDRSLKHTFHHHLAHQQHRQHQRTPAYRWVDYRFRKSVSPSRSRARHSRSPKSPKKRSRSRSWSKSKSKAKSKTKSKASRSHSRTKSSKSKNKRKEKSPSLEVFIRDLKSRSRSGSVDTLFDSGDATIRSLTRS